MFNINFDYRILIQIVILSIVIIIINIFVICKKKQIIVKDIDLPYYIIDENNIKYDNYNKSILLLLCGIQDICLDSLLIEKNDILEITYDSFTNNLLKYKKL